MGAGATGPFLVLRLALLRLGVGLPLGSVLRDPAGAVSAELAVSIAAGISASYSRPLLRPSSFTVARLLRGQSRPEWPRNASLLGMPRWVVPPTLTSDERLPVMNGYL
jgi:hypothetical protein